MMLFPWHTVEQKNGCIYQMKKLPNSKKKTGEVIEKGRPKFLFEGDCWLSARLSYHLNRSPIPRKPGNLKTGLVLHKCDDKFCINPDHLYLGTCSQNAKDRSERNESWVKSRKSLHSADGKRRISEALRLRKGEKRKMK